MASGAGATFDIAFIVVVYTEGKGYAGGYLRTDEKGVPLEFRYTSYLNPTKQQELLYGRTLKPQLFGRSIAGALIKGAESTPSAIVTDEEAVLDGIEEAAPPVLLMQMPGPTARVSATAQSVQTATGAIKIGWKARAEAEARAIASRLANVDLSEPLERAKRIVQELATSST